jgi:hypothetical protein
MILCQGGVKMILVDRYDHSIYYYGRKQCSKEIELLIWWIILKFSCLNLNICEVVQEI